MSVTSNRTLLEKADIALSDLTTAGELQPKQAAQFVRLAIKQAVLLRQVTVVPMTNQKERRDKLRFSGRVLQPGDEATALPLARRSVPALSQVELDVKLFKAEVRMSNEVLEDQIEHGEFKNTIMESLSEAISRDMEFVVVQGDTTSANALLAKMNGLLVQATSNVFAGGGTALDRADLNTITKTMPDEFANDAGLKFFTTRQARQDYLDSVAQRATAGGDKALMGSMNAEYQGIPIEAIPEFPISAGATNLLYMNPKNVLLGVHRKITMETDKDVSAGQLIVVATMRFDARFLHEPAVVKATGINS